MDTWSLISINFNIDVGGLALIQCLAVPPLYCRLRSFVCKGLALGATRSQNLSRVDARLTFSQDVTEY